MKTLPYIGIIILLIIILVQNFTDKDPKEPQEKPKIDTVYVYKYIKDTITIEKPVFIAGKIDTVWLEKPGYVPSETYEGLLSQYKKLGNYHFTTNTFQNTFKIGEYGSVTVTDSIYGNWLMNSTLVSNLKIPTTTITKETTSPSKNQLYVGTTFTGNLLMPISGVYGGLLFKTKKDRIYGASLGYTDKGIMYAGSLYWKIKIK